MTGEIIRDTAVDQPQQGGARRLLAVRAWLFGVATLIATMVVVGGATRLTDSGLSITEWQVITGTIPPIGEAQWQDAFAKYQEIPEYRLVNRGMTLAEFKEIYWWEWAHRFLGRFIGIAFLVPFVFFWLRRYLPPSLTPKLLGVFVLGGLQGALGWYMVQSGLVDRVDVSQYRLAAHLGLAVGLFGYVVWIALGLRARRPSARPGAAWPVPAAAALSALIFLQIVAGAFVAGLDAGQGYNTWPLMDGAFVPDGLAVMSPAWRNLFENAMTVQFSHRMLAYVLIALTVLYVAALLRRSDGNPFAPSALAVLVVMMVQAALGIATLLHQVPMGLALCHQAGALALLALALNHLHLLVSAGRQGAERAAPASGSDVRDTAG